MLFDHVIPFGPRMKRHIERGLGDLAGDRQVDLQLRGPLLEAHDVLDIGATNGTFLERHGSRAFGCSAIFGF